MGAALRYVLIPKFCELTGHTEETVRRWIARGQWRQGREYVIAPDRHTLINTDWAIPPQSSEEDRRCGVYLLRQGDEVVYVGRSTRMGKRLAEHHASGRPFDGYEVIPCDEKTSVWLERELIRTLKPAQNLVRYRRHAEDIEWEAMARGFQ